MWDISYVDPGRDIRVLDPANRYCTRSVNMAGIRVFLGFSDDAVARLLSISHPNLTLLGAASMPLTLFAQLLAKRFYRTSIFSLPKHFLIFYFTSQPTLSAQSNSME